MVTAIVEPSLANAKPDDNFQLERHGYFVADLIDHTTGKQVFYFAIDLNKSRNKQLSEFNRLGKYFNPRKHLSKLIWKKYSATPFLFSR